MTRGVESAMQQWEYLVIMMTVTTDETQPQPNDHAGERLNQFGRDGWEVVGVSNGVAGATVPCVLFLKRPRKPPHPAVL
jgi:hypothetical protein